MASASMRLSDLWTAASAVTAVRLALAATVPFWIGGEGALAFYLLAIATDLLDGAIARRTGTSTRTGAVFDAWADKILHVQLGWSLGLRDLAPDWWGVAWCTRELVQGPLVFVLAYRFRTMQAPPPRTSVLGRLTSVSLFFAVCLALAGRDAGPLSALTGLLGLAAGLHYAAIYLPPRPLPVPDRPDAPAHLGPLTQPPVPDGPPSG